MFPLPHRRWWLIHLVGVWGCATAPVRAGAGETPQAQTARWLAVQTPCDLAAAILRAGLRFGNGPEQAKWRATVDTSRGEGAGLSKLPIFLVLEPDERVLLGWGRACDNGLSGPPVIPGGTVEFYRVEVTARDPTILTFAVTPRFVEFDDKGRRLHDVEQGPAVVVGELSRR